MVMVGRAAAGAPWIFSQINAWLDNEVLLPDPPMAQKMMYLLQQGELMCKYKDPYIAMLQIRKHAAWYIKGLRGAARLREKCSHITSFEHLKEMVAEVMMLETENENM